MKRVVSSAVLCIILSTSAAYAAKDFKPDVVLYYSWENADGTRHNYQMTKQGTNCQKEMRQIKAFQFTMIKRGVFKWHKAQCFRYRSA